MSYYLNLLKKTALSLFFPPLCPVCEHWNGSIDDGFCPKCFKELYFIKYPVCHYCGEPMEYDFGENGTCMKCMSQKPVYTRSRSVFAYDDVSCSMILRFKNGDATYNSKLFAKLMFNTASDFVKNADIIIPVPVHPMRLIKRKYNQAGLLAADIAFFAGKQYDNYNLIRIKNTKSQRNLDGKGRLINVKNAFTVKNPFTISDKNVILVDDVYTTGATVNECASALFKAKAKSVTVLTLAKVINKDKNDNT